MLHNKKTPVYALYRRLENKNKLNTLCYTKRV